MKKYLSTLFSLCLFSFLISSCSGSKSTTEETPIDGEVIVEEVVTCCKLDSTAAEGLNCDTTKSCHSKSTVEQDSACKKGSSCSHKK